MSRREQLVAVVAALFGPKVASFLVAVLGFIYSGTPAMPGLG
jgi:hypothetical protein